MLAKILGVTVFDVGRVKASVRRSSKKSASDRLKKLETKDEEPESPKPRSVYKTETDANSILKEILSTHPDVTDRMIL